MKEDLIIYCVQNVGIKNLKKQKDLKLFNKYNPIVFYIFILI